MFANTDFSNEAQIVHDIVNEKFAKDEFEDLPELVEVKPHRRRKLAAKFGKSQNLILNTLSVSNAIAYCCGNVRF